MLVTFLIGLALGGFIYARVLGGREARLSTFGLIELWVGLSALATIPLFERLPLIFVRLLHGFGDTFTVFLYLQIFLSALVMFIPTVLLGMTFPLVARLFTQSVYRVGSGVGSSYAANTVGAVVGAFAGGFILIPNLGVQNTIIFAVVMNLLIGSWLVISDAKLSFVPRYALGLAVLVLAIIVPFKVHRWDPHVLTSGVTIYADRYESLPTDSLRVEEMKRDDVLFYREGLTTTVSVHSIPGSDYVYFKSNGKIDGSYGDALSQLMTSYIAMLLHPTAERALTIGLGSGMSAKALATFKSLKRIEIIEIEPAMIQASKFFDRTSVPLAKLPPGVSFPSSPTVRSRFVYDSVADSPDTRVWYDEKEKRVYYQGVMAPAARAELMKRSEDRDYRGAIDRLSRNARNSRHAGVLEDPRVHVIPTDGRNYILATPEQYDVITAESAKHKADPRLVLSIMREESRFNPRAKSAAAARGLLQFIITTARDVGQAIGLVQVSPEDLYEPKVVIQLGAKYIGDLLGQFDRDGYKVAAAYNAGPNQSKLWARMAPAPGDDMFLSAINFDETKDYVRKVLNSYERYGEIYENTPPAGGVRPDP